MPGGVRALPAGFSFSWVHTCAGMTVVRGGADRPAGWPSPHVNRGCARRAVRRGYVYDDREWDVVQLCTPSRDSIQLRGSPTPLEK